MGNIRKLNKLLLIPMILGIFIPTTFAEEFDDVNPGNPYYVSINQLKEEGIIEGYEDNNFRPYGSVNRAEALKMLTLASGIFSEEELKKESDEQPFEDTPLIAWYTKYISAAKEKGIIGGYPNGNFKPVQTINLAETLKIFLESYDNVSYENTEKNLFNDTPTDAWFTKYTAYAASKGLINIYPSNTINPNQEMNRGYLAEIIYRMKRSKEGYDFGKATWYGATVQGSNTASGETFDMYEHTAAHKTLAFGTIVEVTNLANGESVNVKIIDRGPYGPGRALDMTSGAFSEIASLGAGIINIQYKIIHLP